MNISSDALFSDGQVQDPSARDYSLAETILVPPAYTQLLPKDSRMTTTSNKTKKPLTKVVTTDPKEIVKMYWQGSFSRSRKGRMLTRTRSKIRRSRLLAEELRKLEKKDVLWKEEYADPADFIIGTDSPSESSMPTAVSGNESCKDIRKRSPIRPNSGYIRMEDEIGLHHLIKLMRIFRKADERGFPGLNIRQFKAAFSHILGWQSIEQIVTMFKKIDTRTLGTIDWNDFCTYLLNEYQERETMGGQKKDLFPYPLKILQSSLHEIASIAFLPSSHRHAPQDNMAPSNGQERRNEGVEGRYITMSKDGTLSIWNSNLTLNKVVTIEAGKLPWVTDMVLVPNANKILVSLTDNVLSLYDFSGSCEVIASITHLPFTILTMYYWYSPVEPNQAILVLGDTEGGVCIMEFSRATVCLFAPAVGSNHMVTFHELLSGKNDGVQTTYLPKIHSDWVVQVKYWHSIGYVMSCSSDENDSLHLVDLNVRTRGSSLKIRNGVISFDFCREWNIIATGGLDRVLRFWNPYLTGKPIATLKGHLSAIMHVVISHHEHVFTFSKDLELRIWKISDQMCLQIINRCHAFMPHSPTAFFVHPYTELVLIGATHLGALEPLDVEDREQYAIERAFSHDMPLCAALYNENFNQIVSGCHGSVVSVWDVDTGEKVIQFSNCHGNNEITAMAFDPSGRRLLTAGKDGSLKFWNFNSGECLRVLKNIYNTEVSSICFTGTNIIVGGWFRALALYSNSRVLDDDDEQHHCTPKYFMQGYHKEDVLSLAHLEPNLLASASYDGEIYVWNLGIDRLTYRLNAWDEQGRNPQIAKELGSMRDGSSRPTTAKTTPSATTKTLTSPRAGSTKDHHPPEITAKDKRAVEKVAFIPGRGLDLNSASMVAVGAGGWIHMWNVYGGGLIGEFNAWDNERHQMEEEERSLHSITALKVDKRAVHMFTGNSLGYIQEWLITGYCCKVESPVIQESPAIGVAWKAHGSSISSIDLAEDKGLVVSASADHRVRLWTTKGRYIGTFGERNRWNLTYPLKDADLPRRIPNALKRNVSFKTVQVVTGSTTSKWQIAKNLFQMLHEAKEEQKRKLKSTLAQHLDTAVTETSDCILGKFYKRKTRFREPIVNMKLVKDGLFSIYGKLKYTEVKDTSEVTARPTISYQANSTTLPGLTFEFKESEDIIESHPPLFTPSPNLSPNLSPIPNNKILHTEKSLLPPITSALRRNAFSRKQSGGIHFNVRVTGDSGKRLQSVTINASQLGRRAISSSNKGLLRSGWSEHNFLTAERNLKRRDD